MSVLHVWKAFSNFKKSHTCMHTHTHILSGTNQVSWHQKGKTNLDILEQEIVSGSGISWAIYKTAYWPRHNHTIFCVMALCIIMQNFAIEIWQFLACRSLSAWWAERSCYGTFAWPSVCQSVGQSLCLQSVLWQNGWLYLDAVWVGEELIEGWVY